MTEYKKADQSTTEELSKNKHGNEISPNDSGIFLNYETFYCVVCAKECDTGSGVILQQCCHCVCLDCIVDWIKRNTEVTIKCPYSRTLYDCNGVLLHCEIRRLVNEEVYSNFLELSLKRYQPTTVDELKRLDDIGAVENNDEFECPICLTQFTENGDGIILRNCFHTFCKNCLVNTIETSENVEILCPFVDGRLTQCTEVIEQREIRNVLSEPAFMKYLQRGLSEAELKIQNAFHCLKPNCEGFFIVEAGDKELTCSVCLQENCVDCKAIHSGITCAEYKDRISGNTKKTMKHIESAVSQQLMMKCPRCKNYVIKNGGCNHMTCRCGAEFQWHGRR